MALLWVDETPPARRLETPQGYLRHPRPGDWSAWAELRAASRAFLEPWEPAWTEGELTRAAYRKRIRRYVQMIREETGFPFFLFDRKTDALVGGVTLSQVRRGVAQAANLGYWMGEPFAGQGRMGEAVRAVTAFAVDDLGLNRVEAACLPHNAASRRVLERCGYEVEGYARRYLRIAGEWRDHVLYAHVRAA